MTATMPQLHVTSWLRELAPAAPLQAAGDTVGVALAALFAQAPQARSCVLDNQGRLRKHVCIFAVGKRSANDKALGQPIGPNARLYVMRALSGG
jgi:sulfur-carrier protein